MRDVILSLLSRFERIILYGLVGAGMTMLYAGVTSALMLTHALSSATLASAVACCVTIPTSFMAHRRTSYADIAQDERQKLRFAALALSTFVISTMSMRLVEARDGPFWLGLLIGSLLVPVANFSINTLWVFRARTWFSMERRQ